jgi:integrase
VKPKRAPTSTDVSSADVSSFPFFQDFLESRGNTYRFKPATRATYENLLTTLFRRASGLGVTHPSGFTPTAIDRLERQMAEALAPASVSTYLRHLKAYLMWCHAEGHVSEPPRFKVKDVRPAMGVFSEDEFQRVLKAAGKTVLPLRNRAILMLMGKVGLRVSEVCRLTLADYKDGRVRLGKTKTGNDRWLPLAPSVHAAIEQYRQKERPRVSLAYLFLAQDGGPLRPSAVTDLCNRLTIRTLIKVNPHRFRRYFAVHGVRQGVPPFVIQEFLGHRTLEMTRRYVELAGMDLEAYKAAWD